MYMCTHDVPVNVHVLYIHWYMCTSAAAYNNYVHVLCTLYMYCVYIIYMYIIHYTCTCTVCTLYIMYIIHVHVLCVHYNVFSWGRHYYVKPNNKQKDWNKILLSWEYINQNGGITLKCLIAINYNNEGYDKLCLGVVYIANNNRVIKLTIVYSLLYSLYYVIRM